MSVRVVAMTVSSLPKRLDYLRQTLNSWRSVRGLQSWLLRFHVEPGPLQQEFVNVLCDWIDDINLSYVDIVRNTERLGVLGNPWSAFDSAFTLDASAVVLVEEDVLVSTDVLDYFSHTLTEYQSNPRVLAVCGSYFGEDENPSETYLAQDFCPLVWATWSDRWREVLRDTWDKDYSTGNRDGSQAGWDWNIRKRLLPARDMVCVWPRASRALHIGRVGVHMRPEDFRASQAPVFVADR